MYVIVHIPKNKITYLLDKANVCFGDKKKLWKQEHLYFGPKH